jgi:hypothetical protein
MNTYDKILNNFVDKEPGKWNSKPFLFGELAGATDNVKMVYFWRGLVATLKLAEVEKERLARIYKVLGALYPTPCIKMKVEFLKDKIKGCPKEDKYSDCPACNGTGDVVTYFKYNGTVYELTNNCPLCNGSGYGEPIGRVYKKSYYMDINTSRFRIYEFWHLVEMAESLAVDEIYLISQTNEEKGSLFQIGGVSVLLMPCKKDRNHKVLFKI